MNEILKFIEENEILAFDTETDGLNVRKSSVIGFGISNASTGYYIDLLVYDVAGSSLVPGGYTYEAARTVLNALVGKKLITWNASFDMRVTKNNLGVDLLDSLHADVLLMKHTCDEEFPFGLKEVATKLWGTDVKKEKEEMQASIKTNGGTAKEYYKADRTLLSKYCIQDCLLTHRLYAYYSNSLSAQGLEDFYYRQEVLGLYKQVTINMEAHGIALDIPLLQSSLQEINKDLTALESEIQKSILPHMGIFQAWFLNKEYPGSTHTGKVPAWRKKHASALDAWRADNPGAYMFNLLSKHHLKKLFFDTLKETPLSRTPTGQPQVDEDFMDSVASKYSWVGSLITYNKLTKIKGTYIERFLEEAEDGIFYPSYKQHGTVSGRYSGDFQQLPRLIT